MAIDLSFHHKLAIQGRVIHALMMREIITRFGRDNLGVLWLVAEPMIFTLGVATLWSVAGLSHAVSVPPVAFAVTGYSSVLMWRNAASHSSAAVESNKALLYHRGVMVIDVLFTRVLLELAAATSSFAILSLLFVYGGFMSPPVDLSLVVAGWMMLAWFGASLGLLIGAGTALSPIIERLWVPIAYLLFPLSGAAFMMDWLPKKMQDVVQYLPMVHGIELLRQGYFGNVVRTHYDLSYMTESCLVITLVGLLTAWKAARTVEL
jgi:ABC-type polysaccharide/polyol phosphate export permease